MKKTIIYISLLLTVLLIACAPPTQEEVAEEPVVLEESAMEDAVKEESEPLAEYRKITAEEAKDMMVEGNLTIDVRTKEEYDQGHIENALLVPLDTLMREELDQLPDKDQVILVYCRSGNRSRTASQLLVKAGYTQVYDFGGINSWPYDVIKE